MTEQGEDADSGIDRRSVLKTAALVSGMGLIGVPTVGATGGAPCFKDFSCDEDATYVKFEFVEEDGDCYFEEETDTGLIEITNWESKEGEDCEPISVEWETADPYFVSKVMAFGGMDCDEVVDPGYSYDAEGGLENGGGNTAAISNLQFCVKEPQDILGTINLSYEDLPKSDSDWDVNDWVVDLLGEYEAVGFDENDDPLVTEFTFDIVPQARGAGDDHEWHMLFPGDVLCRDGSYELVVKDEGGSTIEGKSASGSFSGGSDLDVTVFPNTEEVFADLENAEVPGQFDGCTKPNEWATLTVDFDEPCAIEIPDEVSELGFHGDGLFFDPWLENLAKPVEVHKGDIRLVVVPDDWYWPLGAVKIWDAYDGVSEGGDGYPSYDESDWYLVENIVDENLVATCDFDPEDLGA
ncbi:hypothetical protein [Halanaeroarchaeum sp. HSR-CO]|uniref:hypothetical protein n=1 Tax=Halanaeroarchaeum sp. HSR-CO TaxID=2866382 RepID=UPI00217E3227|nr:hypothetical protein [Halanaeroarchaeum sp. HSR-CO]